MSRELLADLPGIDFHLWIQTLRTRGKISLRAVRPVIEHMSRALNYLSVSTLLLKTKKDSSSLSRGQASLILQPHMLWSSRTSAHSATSHWKCSYWTRLHLHKYNSFKVNRSMTNWRLLYYDFEFDHINVLSPVQFHVCQDIISCYFSFFHSINCHSNW